MSEVAHRAEPPLATTWLRALRQSLALVVALTVLGALAGVGGAHLQHRQYQASTQLMLLPVNGKDAGDVNSTAGVAQSMVSSYAQAVTSRDVMTAALAEASSSRSVDEALKDVSVTVPSGTVVLDIAVRDTSPAASAALANAIGHQFVQQAPRLMPKVSSGSTILQPTVLRPASEPASPTSLGTTTWAAVGAFLGFAVGMALALWRRKP